MPWGASRVFIRCAPPLGCLPAFLVLCTQHANRSAVLLQPWQFMRRFDLCRVSIPAAMACANCSAKTMEDIKQSGPICVAKCFSKFPLLPAGFEEFPDCFWKEVVKVIYPGQVQAWVLGSWAGGGALRYPTANSSPREGISHRQQRPGYPAQLQAAWFCPSPC